MDKKKPAILRVKKFKQMFEKTDDRSMLTIRIWGLDDEADFHFAEVEDVATEPCCGDEGKHAVLDLRIVKN